MTDFLKRTWAQIDLDSIAQNAQGIQNFLGPDCLLMGVVKADAYGHGDHFCALEMEKNGVRWFGVSNLDEALSLRAAGIQGDMLIFGTTPPDKVAVLSAQHITQTVFSPQYARALMLESRRQGVRVDIHIKVDTGMERIGFDGFDAQRCADEIEQALDSDVFSCEGIFTHFASADEDSQASNDFTRSQFERFMQVLDVLEQRGIRFRLRHCCNSAATLRFPHMHLDMVRPGIILYGLYPAPCCRGPVDLSPAMQLKSIVSMVKRVPAGRSVSYGRMFVTSADPTYIATVPIGYADGYHRALSDKGRMLLHAREARVIGRVCMDQLMLDVTGIDDVCMGDEVTIIGRDGEACLSVENMAQLAGTVHYEIVCLIGKRVPRLYTRQGAVFGVARYQHGITT